MLGAEARITLAAGQYRLCEALASSAYGVIWRAQAPGGKAVALKLINRAHMARAHPDQRTRWIASANKEIAFLRSLEPWDERHIVRLLDSGEHEGLPVMALELLSGDLAGHVTAERSGGRVIALEQVLGWIGQINQALAKVHQYGWLYLDLKPANVLLNGQGGSVKLADFGTSSLQAELPERVYAGTANWQAPEQFFPSARHTYDTDARTDYFALGAMFYYLVTGGLALRFCSDCGQAYREHRSAAAGVLLARHAGRMAPTLRDDEAQLFAQRIDQRSDQRSARPGQAGRLPDAPRNSPASGPALVLLRALLGYERAKRPRHAIEISRMLAAIGEALAGTRAPAALRSRA